MQNIVTTRALMQLIKKCPINAYRTYCSELVSAQKIGNNWIFEHWEVAELREFLAKNNNHFDKKNWRAWRKEKCGV